MDLTTYGNAGAARTYTWDAANRLSAVAPALDESLLTADHRRVEFAYDYRNRMIAKQTYAWNPNATPAATWELSAQRKFVWSDWLLLVELDGLNSDAVVRKYTWGLDLAGLNGGGSSGDSPAFLEAAGGIGGLLATKNEPGGPATHAALTCDANGNVTQAFQWSTTDPNAALVAHYEYDPYGNRINTPDPSEYDQPFRFSTKMYDPTSELSYFGYRHYSPPLGRWIKRDPIGEKGGKNLYAAMRNNAAYWVDPDGYQEEPASQPSSSPSSPPTTSQAASTRPRARTPGTFDVMLGNSDRKLGGGCNTAATIRYTATKAQKVCCKKIRLLQMVETEVDLTWGTWGVDEARPPHWDGSKKGKRREPGACPWPFYDDQDDRTGSTELDDDPGHDAEPRNMNRFSQSFETCAVCVSGPCRGTMYGCRKWGHFVDSKKKLRRWGGGLALAPEAPSSTFLKLLSDSALNYSHGDCGCASAGQ